MAAIPSFEDFVRAHERAIADCLGRTQYSGTDAHSITTECGPVPSFLHISDATHKYGIFGHKRFGHVGVVAYWSANSGWIYAA